MAKRVVSIHQPQYLPWIPYFAKIVQSDVFVILDSVQFQKNGVQNRNQIKTAQGAAWLTVPVKHDFGQAIQDVEIADRHAVEKHIKTLQANYAKAPYFTEMAAVLNPILQQEHRHLVALNSSVLRAILTVLEYRGEVICASQLKSDGVASELIVNLCRAVHATEYLSGSGGKAYLQLDEFMRADIQVTFQSYPAWEYPQCFPKIGFVKDLSIVDLLYNVGPAARTMILQGSAS